MAQQTINIGTTANDGTGDPLRGAFDKINDNFTELYNDESTAEVNSITAGDGLTGDTTVGSVTLDVTVDDSTIELSASDGSGAVRIKDDGVTHAKLEGRYTDVDVISSTTSPITLDASSFSGFDLTGNLGTVTLEIQGIKKGQVIDILLSGADLSSAAITLDDNFTSSTINKVGTTSIDTASKNIIQVLCIDDDTNAAELNWAVASYAAGATV